MFIFTDFHHEMSSGLTTALEFLMSAEIAKTFLLQNLESVEMCIRDRYSCRLKRFSAPCTAA